MNRDKAFDLLEKSYQKIEKYIKGHNKHQPIKLVIEGYSFEEWHHPQHKDCGSDPYCLRVRFRWDKCPSDKEPVIIYKKYQFDFILYSINHSSAIDKLKILLENKTHA